MQDHLIAYDFGTGGIKASLYTAPGESLASAFHPYETRYPHAGWHEQRPDDWWDSFIAATKMLIEKSRIDKILAFEEIKALIIALGTSIAETYDPEKARYHRIIIMTDADVDGAHIRTLLLTFFYRYMPELIEKGYIYIAQPPLYAITRGKEKNYAYTEEEKVKVLEKMGISLEASEDVIEEGERGEEAQPEDESVEVGGEEESVKISGEARPSSKKAYIQRYKGLGEMNPNQLWETTMDPANRVLLRVAVEDAEQADEIMTTLMGDVVEPRKRFIQTHAKKVNNLDI